MLVWSPNHCVSDAKREWVGPCIYTHPWELGCMPVCLRSGLEAEMWVQPLPGAQAGRRAHLGRPGLGVTTTYPRPGPIRPCS